MSQGEFSQTRQMQTQVMRTRQSIAEIMRHLVQGAPHFVRCLRRGTAAPGLDKKYLTEQIRTFSLVEAIKIRQNGFSHRVPIDEFIRR